MTCGEPEALLYARGPHWRRRCVCKERLRAALRWCSSRPRLARMGPLRHHGAPARRYYAQRCAGALPAHGSRVWVHYGITAHPHSSTVQNRSGTPFRYAAVHENLTGSQESRVARAYVHILRIYQRLYKNREKLDQHACISLRDRSQQRWLAFSGYFVARRVCECDSVWGAGAAWRGSFWPTFRAIPPPSVLVPSPLSLIRRPPRPRPGRIHVRAPPPARGAGAQLPALELLYYRVSCGGVCVVQCVG